MADNLPNDYAAILNWAAQNLVRQPDGSFTVAPQYSQPTSVNDVYAGIYGPSSGQVQSAGLFGSSPSVNSQATLQPSGQASASGLVSHSVPTYAVDQFGIPIVPGPTTSGAGRTTTAQAGSAQMAAARPAVVDSLYGLMGNGATASAQTSAQPRQTYTLADLMGIATGQARLPSSSANVDLPAGQYVNPSALASGSPGMNMGTGPRMAEDNPLQITINGGASPPPQLAYTPPAPTPPAVAAINSAVAPPRPRPNVPPPPSYTIQRGDTLDSLSRRFGTTIAQLANANNIADPNRIRAGANLDLSFLAAPTPQQRPRSLGGTGNATATSQPAGYGSRGYSAAGQALRDMFGN